MIQKGQTCVHMFDWRVFIEYNIDDDDEEVRNQVHWITLNIFLSSNEILE